MRVLSESVIDLGSLVLSSEQLAPRTPGVHVSAVIRHIATTSGLRKDNDFTEGDLDQFAAIGRLWEAQLAASLFQPPRHSRVGEIECDGIIGSPDSIDEVDWCVDEFKVTWKSAKRDIHEFTTYWWQIKAYCYMLGMTRARLHVFYVSGNYHPPVPIARVYSVVFAPAELESNWAMLKQGAIELGNTVSR